MLLFALAACAPDLRHDPGDVGIGPPPLPPGSELVTEDHAASRVSEVDVLFVIDDTGSMLEEQGRLVAAFDALHSVLAASRLDWHLGVVTTDMVDQADHIGKLQHADGVGFITADDPPDVAAALFGGMAAVGTQGSLEPSGRAAAYTLIEQKRDIPRNAGFYRPSADLHVVFVADDDDVSPDDPVSADDFVDWLDSLKPAPAEAVAHAITQPTDNRCGPVWGEQYQGYAERTGGLVLSSCVADYTPELEVLGETIAAAAHTELFLSAVPARPEIAVEVRLDDAVVFATSACEQPGCGAAYDPVRNSVRLGAAVDPHATIRLQYEARSAE
ncbi:MAG: hypothetical protein H6737_22340 [Alphaproteobacteria bacterium]|nr:hypothetical protein [Alphaproteobacteria bacterium]